MFFAQLPISIFGFVVMAVGSNFENAIDGVSGALIIGAGLTGATVESCRGKRYMAFKKSSKKRPTKMRKWKYSIHR